MQQRDLCPYCGAGSRRSCEWEEMTDQPADTAPCHEDEWDAPDHDILRDDRNERNRLAREDGGWDE